ncbi:MAG TPA: large conductance mechanosensitive channel protein MscL [Afifellaceae bacterium]|nr:large conductance mechanosensitive channel protein MscL [Afifellaceae bacterium]
MWNEFREFALKGNMVDLAIGIIIGAAFSGLVNSVVNDLFMPVVGWLTGGVDFSNLFVQLSGEPQPTLEAAREAGATLAYGNFLTLAVNFLIVAWILFLFVKGMNRLRRRQEEAPEEQPTPADVTLLTEIRDLLADRRRPAPGK